MSNPIPLYCNNNTGSGFLVTDDKSTWLVTCVHIVSGKENTSQDANDFKSAKLIVVGSNIEIPLYLGNQQRFYGVHNELTGYLVDSMVVKLTPMEAAALIHYGTFDRNSVVEAKVGDTVTAMGFPGLERGLIQSKTIQATVVEITGLSIHLSHPSAASFSGGPVIGNGGLIGLVYADVGKPPNFTNALVISFGVVASHLFGSPP